MVGSSKILTVSYGTYSVTAEGFEDPLGVVKETTRFIRGVVNEDPLFGAEPPQIGSEMIEDYIQSRFASPPEARLTFNAPAASTGALAAALAAGPARPAPAMAAPALPDDDTIEAAARALETDETDANPQAEPVSAAPDLTAEAAPSEDEQRDDPVPQRPDPQSVAAKLERIRSVVSGQVAAVPAPAATPGPTPKQDVPLAGILGALEDDAETDRTDTPMGAGEPLAEDPLSDRIAGTLASMLAEQDTAPAVEDKLAALLDGKDPAIGGDWDLTDADEAQTDGALAPAMPVPVKDRADEDEDATGEDYGFDWGLAGDEPEFATRTEAQADEDQDAEDWDEAELLTRAEAGVDEDEYDWDEMDLAEPASPAGAAVTVASTPHPEEVDADWDDFADSATPPVAMAGSDASATDEAEDWDAEADWQDFAETAGAAAPAAGQPSDEDEDWDALADEWDEPETTQATPVPPAPQPARAPLRARVVKVKRAIFDRAVKSGQLEEIEDEAPPAARPAASTSLSPEEEDELARELAAVKAELSGQLEDWDEDEDEEDAVPRSAAAKAPVASGWDEAEAEDEDDADDWDDQGPERGIGQDWDDEEDEEDAPRDATPLRLEHPVARTDVSDDETAIEGARKAVKMASPARALLTEQKIEDFDASRILDQTNEELEEPEGNRRRSAIAHLRAAVAATRADRLLGRKRDTEEEAEPYREDLATVVRPRRPQPASGRTDRPADVQRPAPLKLVAEQRIPGTVPAEPVRPRRVSRADMESPAPRPATPADAGRAADGFAAYADRMGARDLPELLEAAAAYMSFVEGRDQFSRPQLMTTMRQAELTESSREDRLRSFGQLLREGKIEKASGGRFTASDRISFKPRKAG